MRKQDLHPRTAVLNKEQKNHSKTLRITALQWLAIHFPLAFDNSSCIRPLKIGIMEDILVHADKAAEVGISKSKLREALVLFTRRLDYLTCLKIRERRIDLQGHEVTEVTLEEAEHAAVKIKKRVEKSARNARKQSVTKVPSAHAHHAVNTAYSKATNQVIQEPADYLPTYPIRSASSSSNSSQAAPTKVASIIVKHKTSRAYDPSAVARLKEKLGLSRALEEKKETSE